MFIISVFTLIVSTTYHIRLQVQGGKEKYQNMAVAFRKIAAEEGLSALYKGNIFDDPFVISCSMVRCYDCIAKICVKYKA